VACISASWCSNNICSRFVVYPKLDRPYTTSIKYYRRFICCSRFVSIEKIYQKIAHAFQLFLYPNKVQHCLFESLHSHPRACGGRTISYIWSLFQCSVIFQFLNPLTEHAKKLSAPCLSGLCEVFCISNQMNLKRKILLG
jgi:hypothetical protein